jgi:hypothetical protein
MVQPFDLRRQSLSRTPQVVAEGVVFDGARVTGHISFSSSPATRLVYQRAAPVPMSQLTWLDADGRVLGAVGDPAQFVGDVAVSPDGRRAIVAVQPHDNAAAQLWMIDLASGVRSPFTADSSGVRSGVVA